VRESAGKVGQSTGKAQGSGYEGDSDCKVNSKPLWPTVLHAYIDTVYQCIEKNQDDIKSECSILITQS
jgi:hypothetical protein